MLRAIRTFVLALVAIALVALGALAGSPRLASAGVLGSCQATAGGITFAFEPDVFGGGSSAWDLVRGATFWYVSDGLDTVKARPGKPIKLKDSSRIDETASGDEDIKAKLKATITGNQDSFDVQMTLKHKDIGPPITVNASGSCT